MAIAKKEVAPLPVEPEELTKYQRVIDLISINPTINFHDLEEKAEIRGKNLFTCLSLLLIHGYVENSGTKRLPNWKVHKEHLIFCDCCKEPISPGRNGGYLKDSLTFKKSVWLHNKCLNIYLEGRN